MSNPVVDDALATIDDAIRRIGGLRAREDLLVAALKELRSAAMLFRDSAYNKAPTLRVSNEAVNMLSASLLVSQKLITKIEQERL